MKLITLLILAGGLTFAQQPNGEASPRATPRPSASFTAVLPATTLSLGDLDITSEQNTACTKAILDLRPVKNPDGTIASFNCTTLMQKLLEDALNRFVSQYPSKDLADAKTASDKALRDAQAQAQTALDAKVKKATASKFHPHKAQ